MLRAGSLDVQAEEAACIVCRSVVGLEGGKAYP